MDLLNLCLKIPNLGILIYYLVFVVIIPYLLLSNYSVSVLKYYMPLMLLIAHLLTRVGNKEVFKNLYELQPDNFVSFLSSNFINLFALFGIIWQTLDYNKTKNNNITYCIVYGLLLFIIVFPLGRTGLKFILDNGDLYLKEQTNVDYKYNWHLIVIGLLYIIFVLGLQAIILTLVDVSMPSLNILKNNIKKNNGNNRVSSQMLKKSNNPKPTSLVSRVMDFTKQNILPRQNKADINLKQVVKQTNLSSKQKANNTMNFLKKISLSNVRNVTKVTK